MSDAPGFEEAPGRPPPRRERVFLVVVDDTAEMRNALRYACRRALRTQGRVALVDVIEPVEFRHWLGVGRMLADEARQAAERRAQTLAADVFAQTGAMPVIHIREGKRAEEVVKLLGEEPSLSALVLGTAAGAASPGPVVSHVIGSLGRRIRVPVTLIPGELTAEEIDELT